MYELRIELKMSIAALWNRSVRWTFGVSLVGLGMCLIACGGSVTPRSPDGATGVGDGDPNGTPSDEMISFKEQIQPIFTVNCAGCHSPGGAADLAGIRLTLTNDVSYDLLVNQQSVQDPSFTFVVPGEAESSLLLLKVSSDDPPIGDRMPRFAPPLTAAEIALIRDWINQGAPDN